MRTTPVLAHSLSWDSQNQTSKLNCSNANIIQATGAANADGTCSCVASYSYNNVTFACDLDCSRVAGWKGTASTDNLTCECKFPLSWDSSTKTCKLNCSNTNIPHATGAANDNSQAGMVKS